MDALHRQVLPFLLRRMKEDVLQDLPPKIIQDYYCTLSLLQVRNLVIVVVGDMFISGMLWISHKRGIAFGFITLI